MHIHKLVNWAERLDYIYVGSRIIFKRVYPEYTQNQTGSYTQDQTGLHGRENISHRYTVNQRLLRQDQTGLHWS